MNSVIIQCATLQFITRREHIDSPLVQVPDCDVELVYLRSEDVNDGLEVF